jgi:IclR family transcriptional regulator, KDG regulon repressor
MSAEDDSGIDPKNYITSVEKALRLLELFGEGTPYLTISEIVRRGGYSRTATYRLLGTLEHLGWMLRSGDKYQLSLRAFQVGSAAVNALQLRHEATPVMADLASRLGETVYLMAPDGKRGVCLERIEGHSAVRVMVLDVGKSFPIHVGGGSLAMLAHRADLRALLEGDVLEMPTGKILAASELAVQLEETRQLGYSRSIEDVTPGVAAFGVPIFNSRGQVIAALSIGGLAKILVAREAELSSGLIEAGRTISRKLGHL